MQGTEAARELGRRGWLTLPNMVTLARLALVPVLWWLLVSRGERLGGAVLLGALAATDWVDGQLARRLRQVSAVGKVLDPAADRVLVAVSVVAALVQGDLPGWLAVVVLVREGLVSAGVVALAAAGAARIDVRMVGKAGTFATMAALPLFIAGHAATSWHGGVEDVAWVAAALGLLLGWSAAFSYIRPARAALSSGRAARSAPGALR